MRVTLHFVLAMKMGQTPAESYNEHTKPNQAKNYDSKRL